VYGADGKRLLFEEREISRKEIEAALGKK